MMCSLGTEPFSAVNLFYVNFFFLDVIFDFIYFHQTAFNLSQVYMSEEIFMIVNLGAPSLVSD